MYAFTNCTLFLIPGYASSLAQGIPFTNSSTDYVYAAINLVGSIVGSVLLSQTAK